MRGILGGISSRVGPPTSTPFRMLLTASLRSDRLQFSSRRVPSGFRVDFSFFVFRLFQEKWKPRGLLRARWRPRIVCFEKKNGRPTRPTRGGRFEQLLLLLTRCRCCLRLNQRTRCHRRLTRRTRYRTKRKASHLKDGPCSFKTNLEMSR